MWQLALSFLVPMAIHFGVEAVLKAFPGMPIWLKDILQKLEADKAMAAQIECPVERKEAIRIAKAKAKKAIKQGM